MSTNQPRGFNAATDVFAYMQAFTVESVRHSSDAVPPPRGGSHRLRSLVRRHRASRDRSA
jgi:hypothetical protein